MVVGIVNYGVGNILSIQNALLQVGAEVCVLNSPADLAKADKLILPGVGAFGAAVENLRNCGFFEPLLKQIQNKVPILGICVGMQLLFEEGLEHGVFKGLGVIRGQVMSLETPHKIPQIGWNQVEHNTKLDVELGTGPQHSLLEGISNQSWFYFVHSYVCKPADNSLSVGQTEYGERFCSVVQQDCVYGVQFHPEKSQSSGLQLLNNFCSIA